MLLLTTSVPLRLIAPPSPPCPPVVPVLDLPAPAWLFWNVQ
jgi:hypothetical protein